MSYTRASDWRRWKQEGYLLTLPSGNQAMVRPVSLDMLLETKYVPNELVTGVEKMLNNARTIDTNPNIADVTRTSRDYQRAVVYATFISPRIVAEPSENEDEISADDLTPEDMNWIVKWVGQPASVLKKFSSDQIAGLEPVPPFGTDEDTTQPDSAGG